MRPIIYSPRKSHGAALLAAALGACRVDEDGPRSRLGARIIRRGGFTCINWGSSQPLPFANQGRVLNAPDKVDLAISKYRSLLLLASRDIPAVVVSDRIVDARAWLHDGGGVLIRKDRLSGGRGIEVVLQRDGNEGLRELQAMEFFSRYWKKTHEYRIHVINGNVVDIQQKRRRTDFPEADYDPMIRNHDNGWVYCRDNIKGSKTEMDSIGTTATSAVQALGLDFGAVDILARFKDSGSLSKYVVCEINTAPGLEGSTVDKYAKAFEGI